MKPIMRGVVPRGTALANTLARRVHTLPEHPLRQTVTALLHQRPFQRVFLPSLVSSLTLLPKRGTYSCDGLDDEYRRPDDEGQSLESALYPSALNQYEADYRHLRELCEFFHTPPPPHGCTFFTADLGGACKLRWERHTEAQTYTFTRLATDEECTTPFGESSVAISVIPRRWLESLPGLVLSGIHVAVLEAGPSDFASIAQHFHRQDQLVKGCSVDSNRFRVFSDWKSHADGFGRVIIHGMDEAPNKRTAAGKVLQRVIELDKYRALALLALPFAQTLTPRIDALNAELMTVTTAMRSVEASEAAVAQRVWSRDEVSSQRELLDRLCALSAEGLRLHNSSSFRFSASAAYSKIVDDRIAFLQMERIDGLPSMATFIDQALHPAIRTADAVAARLEKVRVAMANTADLLRTSLTVQQQAQNIRELEALQANAKTQLLLQESVEGLSVVAITYYTTGVLGYVVKGASKMGVLPPDLPAEVFLGMSVPIIGIAVYVGLHQMKASVLGHGGSKH